MTYTLDIYENGFFRRTIEATDEQTAIIDYALANPDAPLRLIIDSLAGSAKTSTLEFLCKYMPVLSTVSVAFNKRIVERLAEVLPGHVKPATANSICHRGWAATIGKRLTVDTKKNYNLTKAYIEGMPKRERADAWDLFGDITKALARAKVNGYIPPGLTMGRALIGRDDFYAILDEVPDEWFMRLVDSVLAEAIKQSYSGLVDFDDQVYMGTLFGGALPQYPRVMVDEVQDFSPLNHAMLDRMVGPRTQLIAVGDPWQSIYAFRGADTTSMSRLRERFTMHKMQLSVSFRCPIAVVQNAHWRVPHMRWPSWAKPGRVETLHEWKAADIPDNAAVICRNNAPLLSCALSLLRAGRGVHLIGTDLGPQLIRALKKLGPEDMKQEEVYAAIDLWEQDKLRKARNPDTATDKAECLRVFAGFGQTLRAAIAHC